jgi:ketosteroid isomerase-like protein
MIKMKKLSFFLVFLFLSIITSKGAEQTTTNPDEKVLLFLKNFNSDYARSILNKKPEILVAYFDENIRLLTEFQKTVLGKTNVALYHKIMTSKLDITSYNRAITESYDLGARITEFGNFVMKFKLKNRGKEYQLEGKYLNIWKKEDQRLTLVTECWNYNNEVEISEDLRFNEVPDHQTALLAHTPVNNSISFQLAALCRLQETAITQHDASIWSQFYTDDCKILTHGHEAYEGRKAIDEYISKHVKELPIFEKLDIRNDQIDDLGDYIIEYASHVANWRNGDSSGVNTGKDIRIWRREKDGSLKIFRQIGMYD